MISAKKGYYSLIQFCPNASRLEAVNVGVLMYCPDANFIAARTSKGNRRAAKLVGQSNLDRTSLNAAKRALERRVETDRGAFNSLEDLQRFVDSRGNILKLTQPRPVKVFDPVTDLESLYDELVGGVARRSRSQPVLPTLDETFLSLQRQGRAKLDWEVTVPVLGRQLRVPYAYRNGVWNLVKPYQFSGQEASALVAATRFAIEGDLLFKHESENHGKKQLIIVSSFERVTQSDDLQNRVQEVLHEYNVKTVLDTQITEFLSQVELEAHA
jgi:Protein of unknown function (DUF3037)